MSTKIYNGYKLDSSISSTTQCLQAWWREVRPIIEKEREKLATAMLVRQMVHAADLHKLGRFELKESPYWHVTREAVARVREVRKTMQRDPEVDFDFEICVLPVVSGALAILYTEQESLRKIFQKLPGVSYFGYWDNTDRPRSVSAKDWKLRGELWDLAIPSGAPAHHGFSLISGETLHLMHPIPKGRVPRIKNRWDRAYRHAFDAVLDARFRAHSHDIAKDGFGEFFRVEREVRETAGEVVAELAEDFSVRIPSSYSWEDLRKEINN